MFVADIEQFNKGLRTLDRELQKETRRRMGAIARRERDRIRGVWPKGPAKGGHSFRAVTSGTSGLVPTLKLQRRNPKYPYVPWLLWGGVRRRKGRPWDKTPRRTPQPEGLFFYPGVARARRTASDEIYEALQDARRRAGL